MQRPPTGSARGVYLSTMISLASAAFGVVAALAWNAAITEMFHQILPGGSGILGLFFYAVVVTVIAVTVMVNLAKVAERVSGAPAGDMERIHEQAEQVHQHGEQERQ